MNKYQIKGWYQVNGGPEEVEDRISYAAQSMEAALRMAREDGLSELTFASELKHKDENTTLTTEFVINI
tara:strand:+ start:3839 stop:4045 length:207 start_codon:yes stop_codon:yes gene_type:complete